MLLSFLLLLLPATTTAKHIPFGYQSNSATSPILKSSGLDPSSFAGSIHYDPLHHALYITGQTYATTFDGNDLFNLQHELDGWDLGIDSKYTPDNGDCFYSVFKLPLDRPPYEFVPSSTIQSGVTLMHSRRFGSKSSSEGCSAVDILPASVDENGLGGTVHEFEDVEDVNDWPPTMSPRPSSSTYYPTYLPSVTGRPTVTRGVVPEEVGTVDVDTGSVEEEMSTEEIAADQYFTKSNVASKIRLYHEINPTGILAMKEVQVLDEMGNNVALGRAALQSSDYSANHGAENAVDGDLETFSHTQEVGDNEWWEVSLDGPTTVSKIVIINRRCFSTDNCLARISYVTMELLDEADKVVAQRNFGDTTDKETLEFTFEMPVVPEGMPNPTYSPTYLPSTTARPTPQQPSASDVSDEVTISNIARKVRIQLPPSVGEQQLGIREVEVFDEDSVNVALGKPSSQSSDFNSGLMAAKGNDGDYMTFSDTMSEVGAWWEVDLGSMVKITVVTVLNRWCYEEVETDACLTRMSYATMSLVDDNGFEVLTRNMGDMSDKLNVDYDFWFVEPVAQPALPTMSPKPIDGTVPSPAFAPSDQTLPTMSPKPVTPQPISETESAPAFAPTDLSAPTYSPSYIPSAQPIFGTVDTSTDATVKTWQAQKVRIELLGVDGGGPLTLVEVEVNDIAGGNAAAGAATSQSSNVDDMHPADNAVDLDTTDYSQTDPTDRNAWWEVDLGAMTSIQEIVITNWPENLDAISYSIVTLVDDQGKGVAELNIGDVSSTEWIKLYPTDKEFDVGNFIPDDGLTPRRLEDQPQVPKPITSRMETLSVRLLVAGHVESTNFDDGYIVSDLVEGQYDEANVYGFTQQVDIRLPQGALRDELDFINDLQIMNNPNANINGLEYSLEEESLGGFVTSGIDAKALLNDHLPATLNTLYPVALVADSTSKTHYYVMILAADNADLNDEGKDDSLQQDSTVGSGANQQSWTDYDSFALPGVIDPDDFFGKKGRPRFGSDYRIILKKMEISNVDSSCITEAGRQERRLQSDGCKEFSSIEKILSSKSYNRDNIVHSQTWVQEFTPDLGEDARPAGLIFAPSNDGTSPDLLIMGGSTSGKGVAFGTTQDTVSEGESPHRFDLDGFVMKIRTDNGSFAGKDAFDAATNSFTNTHSIRISSLPNKHDVVASLCSDPLREWGTPEPQDHVYVVGSTEGLLPGMVSGLRDSSFVGQYPEEVAVNSMEAFLMKVDLATMNPVWTVQVAGINLVSNLKGNAYGFGCAVTHDGQNVYLTGMVKGGDVVTDFSADSLKRHDNAARGGTDVFVAGYKTSDGTLNFLRQIGSSKDDMPSRGNGGVTVDRIGNAIIVGNTRGSLMRKRDVAEYVFGNGGADAASDIFIMSLERDTGEYAPISDDSSPVVIPVDNNGVTESSAASQEASQPTDSGSSAASIFLFVVLVLLLAGAVIGSGMFIYKTRKLEQRKAREMHGNFNLSPRGRKRNNWGLSGKPGGSVLNQFEDMNIMIEVRNSASGGWHGVYDDEAIQQIDFLGARGGTQDDVIEQSLFMEDGLQALEEIENSVHNTYSIGDDDNDDEEVTDEDLIQAYNEAMAMDIEPESEAVAAITQSFNMPNLGSEHHEIT